MTGVVVVDANLLVLLVVGAASRDFIGMHKRLQGYSIDDFDLLGQLISNFSEIVLLPHILVEVSYLSGNIANPARARILEKLRTLIMTTPELPIPSIAGVSRDEFAALGLTDAMLLHLCSLDINGTSPTLITVDHELANMAHAHGYSVIDYKQEFQGD